MAERTDGPNKKCGDQCAACATIARVWGPVKEGREGTHTKGAEV
jgi:hypothetical protein